MNHHVSWKNLEFLQENEITKQGIFMHLSVRESLRKKSLPLKTILLSSLHWYPDLRNTRVSRVLFCACDNQIRWTNANAMCPPFLNPW